MFNVQFSKMPVLVKVTQNKNNKTAAYGKLVGRVVSTKTMRRTSIWVPISKRCSSASLPAGLM
jgi:hypothetical protein